MRLQGTGNNCILTDKIFYRTLYFNKILCELYQTPFSVEENEGLAVLDYGKWKEIHNCTCEYFSFSCCGAKLSFSLVLHGLVIF